MTTKIEWADETVNAMVGCSHISPACDHCYAARMALRHGGNPSLPWYKGLAVMTPQGPRWTGEGRWIDHVLPKAALRLYSVRKPLRIFHGSMTDIAHESATVQHLANVLAFADALPQHTHMLLTKRPHLLKERLEALQGPGFQDLWDAARRPLYDAFRSASRTVSKYNRSSRKEMDLLQKAECIGVMGAYTKFPLPNVWLGATIWDQPSADRAVPILLSTPAAKRFVSIEPMLGPVDLCHVCDPSWREDAPTGGGPWDNTVNGLRGTINDSQFGHYYNKLDWVICGGETGPGARPMHPDWPRSLRDQCQDAGVPFFFKQWGEYGERNVPGNHEVYCYARRNFIANEPIGHEWNPDGKFMAKCGKAKAGRLLDGRTWEEVPA